MSVPYGDFEQKRMPETLEFPAFLRLSSMRIVGLEPTRSHLRKILSLVRLPFRHIRIYVAYTTK